MLEGLEILLKHLENNSFYWAIKRKNRYNIQILLENNISLEVSPKTHALSYDIVCDDCLSFKNQIRTIIKFNKF